MSKAKIVTTGGLVLGAVFTIGLKLRFDHLDIAVLSPAGLICGLAVVWVVITCYEKYASDAGADQ